MTTEIWKDIKEYEGLYQISGAQSENNNFQIHRERKSIAMKGRQFSEYALNKIRKPVLQVDKNTGETIKRHSSQMEAYRQLGFHYSVISKACIGKISQAYNYKWRYENE